MSGTVLQQIVAAYGADVMVTENFAATSPAGMYAMRALYTSGLVWAYYGGKGFGNDIPDGSVTATPSATNYVVASRSTGAVSISTSTTDWNDSTNFMRLYRLIAGPSSLSAEDFREAYGGAGGGGGGSNAWADLTGVPSPVEDIAALTDPGADKLLFWDDSAGVYTHLSIGSGLAVTGTTLDASGGGGGGDVVGASNIGTGADVFEGEVSGVLRFYRLQGVKGVLVGNPGSETANTIPIYDANSVLGTDHNVTNARSFSGGYTDYIQQSCKYPLRGTTSDDTPRALTTTGSGTPSAANQVRLESAYCTLLVDIRVVATNIGDWKAWSGKGVIYRSGGNATLGGAGITLSVDDSSGSGSSAWSATVSADATKQCLQISVVGNVTGGTVFFAEVNAVEAHR